MEPRVEYQIEDTRLRSEMFAHIVRCLAAAVNADPSLVAFNRTPGIFSRTRSGRVLEYWHADHPGDVGAGTIQWHDAEDRSGRFVFRITRHSTGSALVRLNDGPALPVPEIASELIVKVFLQNELATPQRRP
jgi:hypothetical protein